MGQECKCFLFWTSNKRSLPWLVHSSFIIQVAFCSVSLTYPPVNGLVFTKKFLKTDSKSAADLLSVCRSLLKQYSNYTSFWQQICAFQLLLIWYKPHHPHPTPPIFGWKIESFQQFFGNEVSNSVEFFLWIPTKVSRLWALWFWKCIDFFALHGGFLHITSFIIGMLQALFFRKFRGGGCMGVCAKFFN